MAIRNLIGTKHHILICNGGSCTRAGAEELTHSIRNEITSKGLDPFIHTTKTLCNGRCQDQCVLVTYPDGNWYKEMSSVDVPNFIESLMTGNLLEAKISHSFNGKCFVPLEGLEKGKE